MNGEQLGRLLMLGGLCLILVGGAVWLLSAAAPGVRLGRLPGDIVIEREGFRLMFPLTTMILVSLLLTGLLWLVSLVRR
jgi:hypothetical protein